MEGKTLKEKIDILFEDKIKEQTRPIKKKKIKIPRKAKVRHGRKKKGWVGILRIDENFNISGERQKIEDSAFTLKGGDTHATNGQEVLFWNGKFPVIIQEVKSLNPTKFNSGENETYGQKYVLAKMLKDAIKVKAKGANLIIWILILGGLFIGAKYIFKF